MQIVVTFLLKVFSNPAGQALLTWLGGKIWDKLSEEAREVIAKNEMQKAVKNALEELDKITEDQIELSKDGLSDQEKEQIRRRKAAAQARILNARS